MTDFRKMADPRIVECAKVLMAIVPPDADIEDLTNCARAVILKWLEQPATKEQMAAGYDGFPWNDAFGGPGHRDGPGAVYSAMCAQAAKEIAE